MAHDLDLVGAGERVAESPGLALPRGAAGREVEERAQEVLGPGVLVEAAGEVGDGCLAVGLLDDGGVQQEGARGVTNRARLGRSHAFEHLDLDHRRIIE